MSTLLRAWSRHHRASLVARETTHLPVQETWIRPLGGEDPPENKMAIHSSVLAWEIPWTEEPNGLQSVGLQRVRCDFATEHTHQTPCQTQRSDQYVTPPHLQDWMSRWEGNQSKKYGGCTPLNSAGGTHRL